jgi:hypothetical protein
MRPDGSHVREFELPSAYRLVDNASTGGRDNKLLEALALSPDGTRLYVANEEALIQDGPVATQHHGSWLRVSALDTATWRRARSVRLRAATHPVHGPDPDTGQCSTTV